MDDKANYSTLVFKNSTASQKDEKEDLTTYYDNPVKKAEEPAAQKEKDNQPIYSEVKPKKQESMAPKANEDPMIYANVKPKAAAAKVQEKEIELTTHPVEKPDESAAADPKGEELTNYSEVKLEESGITGPEAKPAAKRPTSRLLMCLGTLCVLLVAGVIGLLATLMMLKSTIQGLEDNNKMLTEKNTNLTIYNRQLHDENDGLMTRTQELTKGRDDLNWTLEFILTFNTFPVKDFCPNKRCQPCQNSWVLFQNKCYLFYKDASWKTWEASRQFCQNQSADLVVVENLQEQEFISNNTEPYWSNDHGYWLGLKQNKSNWVWVDGHTDTLGYWVTAAISKTGPYVLLMPTGPDINPKLPKRELTKTWDKGDSLFLLRFICERKVLIKSD